MLESTQSSGWVSSGQLKPLSALPFALTRSVFAGPDRTPKFNATWSGSAFVDNLSAHFCAQSPAWLPSGILLNHLSRTFSSQFLLGRWPVSLSSVETLRRAFGLHATLTPLHVPLPGFKFSFKDVKAPPSLSLPGAAGDSRHPTF